jgi:2-polyprenyl-3-methyl-5-hydroxy-6-metoxy-1,4-benzoquinol methylase
MVRRIVRRIRREMVQRARDRAAQQSIADYHRMVTAFNERIAHSGYDPDVENFFWYHTVELPGGLVTPGSYDYRAVVPNFGFPVDMTGMSVLDIGSATGFWAFEFERRGARVTSVELPNLASWDVFPGETAAQSLSKQERLLRDHLVMTDKQRTIFFGPDGLDRIMYFMVEGPFSFCHKVLGSKIQRHHGRIYDLPRELGKFDFVFVSDVLLHTINPLEALASAAALCRRTLVVAQELAGRENDGAAMLYIGGETVGRDDGIWWVFNQRCLEQLLRKLGFQDVRAVGHHTGFLRPAGTYYDRTVIHAHR